MSRIRLSNAIGTSKPAGALRRDARSLSRRAACVAGTVIAAAGTILAAPSQASAAVNEVGSALAYEQGSSGVPGVTWGNNGDELNNVGGLGTGVTMEDGTNAVVAGLAAAPGVGLFQVVWQGANHDLWTTGAHPTDTGAAMMPGTSPSLAELPNGTWVAALQHSDGQLWCAGTWPNPGSTQISSGSLGGSATTAMAADTSPTIGIPANNTIQKGLFHVAWQGANHHLWNTSPTGPTDSGLAMMPKTSPSLAELPTGGLEEAFTGLNGDLWVWSLATGKGTDTGLAMNISTSPSITTEPVTATTPAGSFEVAYQSANGTLSVYGSLDTRNLGYQISGSPSITGVFLPQPLAGSNAVVGYQIAANLDAGLGPSVFSIWAAPGQNSFSEDAEPFGEVTNSPQPSVTSLSQ